jgi:nicotinamide riboside transporter PnuC
MSSNVTLWLIALVAPIAWFVNLELSFAFAPLAATITGKTVLYGSLVLSVLITAAAGWAGWVIWRRTDDEDAESRKSLLIGGVALSVLFFIVILAQIIPNLFLTEQ